VLEGYLRGVQVEFEMSHRPMVALSSDVFLSDEACRVPLEIKEKATPAWL